MTMVFISVEKGVERMTKYIELNDALRVIQKLKGPTRSPAQNELIRTAEVGLSRLPAANVAEVRTGHWIGEGDGYADGEIVYDVWYCSECNYCIDDGTDDPEKLPRYCQDCGARMDGAG